MTRMILEMIFPPPKDPGSSGWFLEIFVHSNFLHASLAIFLSSVFLLITVTLLTGGSQLTIEQEKLIYDWNSSGISNVYLCFDF